MWHVTCDTWHVRRRWTFSQNYSSLTLTVWELEVTCDTWHVTPDMDTWQLTLDMWHLTYDMWHVSPTSWWWCRRELARRKSSSKTTGTASTFVCIPHLSSNNWQLIKSREHSQNEDKRQRQNEIIRSAVQQCSGGRQKTSCRTAPATPGLLLIQSTEINQVN